MSQFSICVIFEDFSVLRVADVESEISEGLTKRCYKVESWET